MAFSYALFFYLSDVNFNSVDSNPLAHLDFAWNNTMIADFKKYETDVKAVVPKCLLKNVKAVEVSRLRNI